MRADTAGATRRSYYTSARGTNSIRGSGEVRQEVLCHLGRDGLGGLAGRSRLGHERGLAVILQLADRLEDVGEGAVPAVLRGGVEVHPREPAAAELFDGGDVDVSVVQ